MQRTDTSAQAARMHCMGHWYAIRGVKACSSFRWIKQFTHLSVAKLIESNLLVSSDTGPEYVYYRAVAFFVEAPVHCYP